MVETKSEKSTSYTCKYTGMNGAKWKNQASALLKRAVDIRFVYLSFFRLFIIPSFFLHALYLHFGLSGTLIVLSVGV